MEWGCSLYPRPKESTSALKFEVLNINREVTTNKVTNMIWLGISRIIYSCVGGKLKKIVWNQYLPRRQITVLFVKKRKIKETSFI